MLMKKCNQNAGYFFNLKKLAIENNHILGENSPNLVTLMPRDPVKTSYF
jgi:hypothetical protein